MVAVACLDPTEVLVHVKTDGAELCGALSKVDFQVSGITSSVASKSRPACVNQEIGTLDFVPSGSASDRFTLDVIGHVGDTTSTVRATRVIGFVSHAKLDLEIVLEKSCVDVACKADETCLHGACVPAKIDCGKNRTCGLDAGDAVDASSVCSVVAPADAIGKLRAAWHFDEPLGTTTIKSTAGDTSTLATGAAIVAGGPAGCGNALSVTTPATVTLLAPFASPNGVNVSLSVKRLTDFPTTLLVQRPQTGTTSFLWKLVVDQSGKLGVVTAMSSWTSALAVPADTKWHRVGLVWDTAPRLSVDDVKADLPPAIAYPGAGGALDLGSATAGAATFLVDELYLFSR